MNLVNNAIDACRSKVKVVLEDHGSEVRIKVMDDGPGLPLDVVGAHLAGRGRSTKRDRQGLGISTVGYIVQSHGGRVVYSASPLGGACFEIRI